MREYVSRRNFLLSAGKALGAGIGLTYLSGCGDETSTAHEKFAEKIGSVYGKDVADAYTADFEKGKITYSFDKGQGLVYAVRDGQLVGEMQTNEAGTTFGFNSGNIRSSYRGILQERMRRKAHEKMVNEIREKYGEELAHAYRDEVRAGTTVISYPDNRGENVFIYRDPTFDVFDDGTMAVVKFCDGSPCDVEVSQYTFKKFQAGRWASKKAAEIKEKVGKELEGVKEGAKEYKKRSRLKDRW